MDVFVPTKDANLGWHGPYLTSESRQEQINNPSKKRNFKGNSPQVAKFFYMSLLVRNCAQMEHDLTGIWNTSATNKVLLALSPFLFLKDQVS